MKTLHGGIEGFSPIEYLMLYRNDGSATFVGMERVVGHIGRRRGSFVLQQTGTFQGGAASATWSVVPGSGTADLKGLRGEGGFASGQATLDYDFET